MAEFNHPKDPANGRYLCSPEHPMPKGAPGRWSHANASETDDERDFGGGEYCVRMACCDCGQTWWRELPQ